MVEKPALIFLIPSLAGGGAERVASILIPYLNREFSLTVVLLDKEKSFNLPDNINVICLSGHAKTPVVHILRIPYHIAALAAVVRKTNADTVLSFMEQANIINITCSLLSGHRPIISQRTDPVHQYAYKGLLGKMIMAASRITYRRAERILTVSKKIMHTLKTRYGVHGDRLHFIPNPVEIPDLDKISSKRDIFDFPYVLHVGRLNIHTKGQDILLKAFRDVHALHPEIKLILVGDGPDKKKIQHLITEYRLDDAVILAGWQGNPAKYMANAIMLVHTSRYEGWPNVLVEAMACRCPVIAADCDTGPREILDNGRYGILFPVGDTEALRNAVLTVLNNHDLREKFRRISQNRAKDFAAAKIASRYIDLIQR